MKRIGWYGRGSLPQFFSFVVGITVAGIAGVMLSCSKPAPQPKPAPSRPSDIKVEVRDGGPVVLTTSTAEFQILPSGFLQASLLKDGKRLTLDEPEVGSAGGSDSIVHDGKELDFVPDFAQAKVLEGSGKLGRGKRVEIPARPLAPAGVDIERMLVVEAYDDFPNIALCQHGLQECRYHGFSGGSGVDAAAPLQLTRGEGTSIRHVVVSRIELRLGERRCAAS